MWMEACTRGVCGGKVRPVAYILEKQLHRLGREIAMTIKTRRNCAEVMV
jgi:hypothetical protein